MFKRYRIIQDVAIYYRLLQDARIFSRHTGKLAKTRKTLRNMDVSSISVQGNCAICVQGKYPPYVSLSFLFIILSSFGCPVLALLAYASCYKPIASNIAKVRQTPPFPPLQKCTSTKPDPNCNVPNPLVISVRPPPPLVHYRKGSLSG